MTATLGSRVSARAAVLTLATGGASVLVGVSQALLAHIMPIREVGAFSFAISFLLLATVVFEFGFFLPLPRLIALQDSEEVRREIVGAAALLFLPVGTVFCGFVALSSLGVDSVFRVHAGSVLLASAPLAWTYAFIGIGLLLAQGTGRVMAYSASSVVGPAAFVAILSALLATDAHVGAPALILIRGACFTIGAFLLIRWLRPSFAHARSHLNALREGCRNYGFKLYVGNVLALGTYQMDILMLAAMTNPRTVALYAVATSITQAIALPGQGISSTLLERMARTRRVPRDWLTILWAVTSVATLAAWLLARPFLRLAFSPAYTAAAGYVIPLGIAAGLRGVTGLYNAQLVSTGSGDALRTCSLVLAISNVILNFALIPPFRGMGAAIASAAAMLANLVAHVYFSRRAEEEPAAAAAEAERSDEMVLPMAGDIGT